MKPTMENIHHVPHAVPGELMYTVSFSNIARSTISLVLQMRMLVFVKVNMQPTSGGSGFGIHIW
jgi:hypothetical protein